MHADKNSYAGEYLRIENATATEVWFAQMLDYLIAYEARVYNWQHPVALVNWPPLDPLTHPTESTLREEVKFRIAAGEKLALPEGPQDDDDSVSIDEAKFTQLPGFQAGLFASYHVYPYYPDFLAKDPDYLASKDKPVKSLAAYLQNASIYPSLWLSVIRHSTSIGISISPLGWNHSGHTEEQQSELLVRFTYDSRRRLRKHRIELLDELQALADCGFRAARSRSHGSMNWIGETLD
jgi:hypothetical protein